MLSKKKKGWAIPCASLETVLVNNLFVCFHCLWELLTEILTKKIFIIFWRRSDFIFSMDFAFVELVIISSRAFNRLWKERVALVWPTKSTVCCTNFGRSSIEYAAVWLSFLLFQSMLYLFQCSMISKFFFWILS